MANGSGLLTALTMDFLTRLDIGVIILAATPGRPSSAAYGAPKNFGAPYAAEDGRPGVAAKMKPPT